MKFSERGGFKQRLKVAQIGSMNSELRNSLWNVFHSTVFNTRFFDDEFDPVDYRHLENIISDFGTSICKDFLKIPIDFSIVRDPRIYFKRYFLDFEWFEAYDFIEFTANYFNDNRIQQEINKILEAELSGYRLLGAVVTDVTDPQEIKLLESTLLDDSSPHVNEHLNRALELLSDRKHPDYRNSIKESISAVETLAKHISKKPKAEFKEALRIIEKQGKIHGALKTAFLSLYGYTSDANGIRHALMEEPNLTAADAKFFLLACTSFINYLKAKI